MTTFSLDFSVTKHLEWSIPKADFAALQNQVEDIVSWRTTPHFIEKGRSAWVPLEHPLKAQTPLGPTQIQSLKIKGVGLMDHAGKVSPPCRDPFFRTQKHIALADDGQVSVIESAPSPLGGISTSRATNEYDASHALLSAGVPAQIPLFVFQYDSPDYAFEGTDGLEQLGVIVAGHPVTTSGRGDTVVKAAEGHGPREMLNGLNILLGNYGTLLCGFHKVGYLRHSGGLGNIAYSPGWEHYFMLDLDTTLHRQEIPAAARSLYEIRDIASVFFHLMGRLVRPEHISDFAPETLANLGIFGRVLEGYFGMNAGPELGVANDGLDVLYQRIHANAQRSHAEQDQTFEPQSPADDLTFQQFRDTRMNKYWIDMKQTFIDCILLCWDCHVAHSDSGAELTDQQRDNLSRSR